MEIATIEEIEKKRTEAFDMHYRTGTWRSHHFTRETIESRLAYALDVDRGGRLTGKEIQFALSEIGSPDLAGKKVLDYCCDTGMTAIYFALCGAEVWAFDVSAEAIKIAEQSAQKSDVSHVVHLCVSDAQLLPYEDNFFLLCSACLHST